MPLQHWTVVEANGIHVQYSVVQDSDGTWLLHKSGVCLMATSSEYLAKQCVRALLLARGTQVQGAAE